MTSTTRKLVRAVALPVLVAAFTLPTAIAASADTTVFVPGTGATKPCTVTFGDSINTSKTPPVIVTETTTCAV